MSTIPSRQRLRTPLMGAIAIVLSVIALFAPFPVAVIATVLAFARAGGQRRLWIAVALFAIALLLWLLIGVESGPIEQPVRIS